MDKNFSDILGIFKRLDESRFHSGGYTPVGDVDEAANAAKQAAIAINMKKKHQKPKHVDEDSLNEFAPGENGGGGNGMEYLHALAQAWYTQDISLLADIAKKGGSPMKKVIDAQVAVEKILSRGVHCPDGKVRKYYIDYNGDFDGVNMASHDYYEYADDGENGEEVDSRTGQPWSPYDHIEFDGDDLYEGSMAQAKHHDVGPEFTGYWKGTDRATPGKKMVGGSAEESIEEQIAREWTQFLGEYGMTTGGTAGGTQPTNSVDQAKQAKELTTTTQNLNKLKSAGVTLPTGINQAAKSTMTTANDPKANPLGNNMDQTAKKTTMGLGQEMEKLLTTGNPTQIQQVATAIKQAKLGTK